MEFFVNFSHAEPNASLQQVMDVHPHSVLQKKNSIRIIDVRRLDEFKGELGHIPGAQLLTVETLPERTHELPKDKTIVFVCRSGGRSARATAFALEEGFKNVFNMQGGMVLWNQLGLETEDKNSSLL